MPGCFCYFRFLDAWTRRCWAGDLLDWCAGEASSIACTKNTGNSVAKLVVECSAVWTGTRPTGNGQDIFASGMGKSIVCTPDSGDNVA